MCLIFLEPVFQLTCCLTLSILHFKSAEPRDLLKSMHLLVPLKNGSFLEMGMGKQLLLFSSVENIHYLINQIGINL